jgi:hypothetical protein
MFMHIAILCIHVLFSFLFCLLECSGRSSNNGHSRSKLLLCVQLLNACSFIRSRRFQLPQIIRTWRPLPRNYGIAHRSIIEIPDQSRGVAPSYAAKQQMETRVTCQPCCACMNYQQQSEILEMPPACRVCTLQ